MSGMQIESGEEEKKGNVKQQAKSVDNSQKEGINLFRVYTDDGVVKTKNQTINRLRDIKKEHREKIKGLDEQQMVMRERCFRKIRKIGLAAKIAASKVPQQQDQIPELTNICEAIVNK